MKSCFIYCRVSTDEQADKGYSLDAQERLCRDYAERNGYNVIEVYREEGETARNTDRPALKKLLSECGPNKSIDAVIVQETDRLARNTKDHLNIKSVLYKAGTKLISVAQPMLDDSPEGNMVDTIIASVNQFQSDINSRKTKRGLQEKFDLGWWPGWAPLGYLNVEAVGSEAGGRPIKIVKRDSVRWDLVHEAFRLYLTGNYSADHINDILYDKGLRSKTGKKIPHSIMVSILKNPFYASIMLWNGQTRIGRHEPMITPEQHQRILKIMDAHNMSACRRRKHSFLLRGFVFCNICGHRFVGEIHQAKKKAYYHCAAMRTHSNRGQNIEVSQLEQAIEDQFKTIQFSVKFRDLLITQLKKVYLEGRRSIDVQKRHLLNQKKAIETKREKAEEKLFAGVISDDDFVRLRAKFTTELGQIQSRMTDLDRQRDIDIDVVQDVLRICRNVHQAYKAASYEEKRLYLGLFWERFLVQDKKIVEAIPTDLIRHLQEEKQVILMMNWLPSSPLIRTLQNYQYMDKLKEKLVELQSFQKMSSKSQVI